jgi:plastocyanin
MRGFLAAAGLAALALSVAACGGYGSASPTDPNGSPAPPPDAITIDVIGINGSQSFSPNPSTIPAGRTVVWHNVDSVTHRVVLDDGELDTGNIGPGRFSTPMTLIAPSPYHCSIHPEMKGRID